MLYLGKYLPPIYFCLFHPPCHWANNMSGRIQNKYLITKSIWKRIYHTFHCLGKFNTGWNCFSNVQGRKKRQSENNPWYSILLVLSENSIFKAWLKKELCVYILSENQLKLVSEFILIENYFCWIEKSFILINDSMPINIFAS